METHVGFRFHPTDEEIVNHYLWNKMVGRSDRTRAIAEIDVYGCEPWELPARSRIQSGDRNWYFFCRPNKRFRGGWSRQTGQGFWKKTGTNRKIKAPDSGSEIGTKKTLVFYNGRSDNGVRTGWVMHEYSPTPSYAPPGAMAYVVCRIKCKGDDKNEILTPCGLSSNNAAAKNALPEVHPQQNVELVNQQKEADFETALQVFIEDQGLSIEDLSPFRSGSNSNEDWMEEGGLSLEDLWQFEGDDNEPDAMQIQVDTSEQEDDFVNSLFADQDDQLSDQDVYDILPDHAPSSSLRGADSEDRHGTDVQLFNQLLRNSVMYNSPSGSKQEHEKRMETAVKHDDILLMNPSGVDSTITTGFAVNPTREGLFTPSKPCKPQNELRSNRVGAVADKCARRVVPQGDFWSKAPSRNKAIKSVDHGPSNVHTRTDTSASKSYKKDQKMNKQAVIKSSSSSSSNPHRSVSSDRKSSSSSSTVARPKGEEFPPSAAHILNVAVGLMIFVAIVLHAWPCSVY